VPYRTTRAFREQLDVVALLGQLEQARARADAAAARGRRRREAHERRRAERLAEQLGAALQRPSLRRLSPEDLLPAVRELLTTPAPKAEPEPEPATAAVSAPPDSRRLLAALACTCAAAWVATFAAAAEGGISGRPELVVPDVVALALTLAAVLVGLRSG